MSNPSPALENVNVESQTLLITPAELKNKLPMTDKAAATVRQGRQAVYDLLDRKDHRLQRPEACPESLSDLVVDQGATQPAP